MIHKRAADNAKLGEGEEEETANFIPEEKLRDEDLVRLRLGVLLRMVLIRGFYRNWRCC
jgi:hypothetical protein